MKDHESIFFAILVVLISFLFFYSPGTSDVKEDLRWISNAEKFGVIDGYTENGDSYPPLIPLFLYSVSKITKALNLPVVTSFKLSLYLFLYLSAVVFYVETRNLFLTSAMILSFILNTVALCYLDIFMVPLLLLSYFALMRNRLTTFGILFAFSCMIKFQPLIFLPAIFIYLFTHQSIRTLWLRVFLPASGVVLIFLLIFKIELLTALARALFYHHQLSANAANLNWLLTYLLHVFKPEEFGPLVNGRADFISTTNPAIWLPSRILFVFAFLWSLKQFHRCEKSIENLLLFSLIGYLIYFAFNTGVHENHLFPAMLLGFLIYARNPRFVRNLVIISVIANLNMMLFYGINGAGLPFSRIVVIDLSVALALLTVIFTAGFWKVSLQKLRST
jgi:hypothetical protein